MAQKRIRSSRFPGVYYRDSTDPRRKHNGRPDRCYDFCYRFGGKLKWVNVGWLSEGFSEQKAANMRREVLERLAQGGDVPAGKQDDVTLDFLADEYFSWLADEGKYADQESLRYNAHVKRALGSVPLRILAQQDSNHVRALKKRLLEIMAPASARRVLGDCRAMVNYGIRKGRWSGINPFGKERLEMPRLQNKGERFLSRDEAKALLSALARRSPQLHDMAWLSLRTGLRSTEIFRLTGADVDEDNNTIWVTEKGRSRMPVRVDEDVLRMLLLYRNEPGEYIFQARGGGKITAISETFDRACVEVGLMPPHDARKGMDTRKKVWFHTLRHTFASWLAQSGKVTIHELREIMRHKSVDMTERYAHLIPGQVQEKTSLIGQILRGE